MHCGCQQTGNEEVEYGANNQGPEDADGHVLLWIFRLLRRSRNGIKSDIGEEDDSSASQYARPPKRPESPCIGRDKDLPVRVRNLRVLQDKRACYGDKYQHRSQLYENDPCVEVR